MLIMLRKSAATLSPRSVVERRQMVRVFSVGGGQ